jgi:hypothetical protein
MSRGSLKDHENSVQMGQVMTPNYEGNFRENNAFRMRQREADLQKLLLTKNPNPYYNKDNI